MPLNETYWNPTDAHDPVLVQQLVQGLTLAPAQRMDLGMARNTKLCETICQSSCPEV